MKTYASNEWSKTRKEEQMMKELGWLLIGGIVAIVFLTGLGPLLALVITLGIAVIVLLTSLGPLVALVVALGFAYLVVKAKSTSSKFLW